ncbi:uncharacterized protein [Primulina eburnea]|uniref:uncharacterized protein n=1 Tax=Primulina eburnea TaxID=1245227 RepID=UPI003C6C3460
MRDADHVRCTTNLFRDDASLWWEGAEHGVNLATLTWDRFKEIFYEKYFTADVRGRLKREFMTLRQGDTSIAESVNKFDRNCHFVPLIARDAAEKLRHFMDGLRPTIRKNVMTMRPLDYATATNYAFQSEQSLKDIEFEVQCKRNHAQQSNQQNKKPFTEASKVQGQQKPGAQKNDVKPFCTGCNRHHYGKCLWFSRKCFKCGEQGHISCNCPKL